MKTYLVSDNMHSERLLGILLESELLVKIFEKAELLKLPNWYIGAGAISQTTWNYLTGRELTYGINDVDLIYFDDDLSKESEVNYQKRIDDAVGDSPLRVEVVNEARVHLWYKKDYGKEIEPYKSTEDAISSWPTTATAVGVRKYDQAYKIYSPFGLDDLLNLTIRPNKRLIDRKIYEQKSGKWSAKWPELKVIPW